MSSKGQQTGNNSSRNYRVTSRTGQSNLFGQKQQSLGNIRSVTSTGMADNSHLAMLVTNEAVSSPIKLSNNPISTDPH